MGETSKRRKGKACRFQFAFSRERTERAEREGKGEVLMGNALGMPGEKKKSEKGPICRVNGA